MSLTDGLGQGLGHIAVYSRNLRLSISPMLAMGEFF